VGKQGAAEPSWAKAETIWVAQLQLQAAYFGKAMISQL